MSKIQIYVRDDDRGRWEDIEESELDLTIHDEEVAEKAFKEGEAQGRADAIAEFKDLGKLYSEIRAEAIDEFESLLYQFGHYDVFMMKFEIYHDDLKRLIQQLKGHNNG